MGCYESKEEKAAREKNEEIEREMMRVKEADAKTIKLLLLGSPTFLSPLLHPTPVPTSRCWGVWQVHHTQAGKGSYGTIEERKRAGLR